MSAANDLVERIRACAPTDEGDREKEAKDHGRGKHARHAKRGGRGKDD